MYLHEKYTPVSLPVRQFKGFERVTFDPCQKKTVTLTIHPVDFMLLDREMLWKVAPGTVEVMIGSAADHIFLQGSLEIKSTSTLPDRGLSTQLDLAR
jgi:beta-glucosidase